MNYEQDIRIDESGLDIEWLDQPRLFMRYSAFLAEKARELDLLNERQSVLRANLDKEIRIDPESFAISKVTEAAITAAILTEQSYQDLQAEIIEARYQHQLYRAAVEAFQHRKTALENLVKLHGQNYFSSPSVPRDLSKEWEAKEKQKTSNQAVSAGLRRSKRNDA